MSGFETIPGFVLTPAIAKAMEEDGISEPTAPQLSAFEPLLAGKNVVIASGTGTGKTLAYLLPLLQRLSSSPEGRLVCLAPAAELALQTLRVADRYKAAELESGALISGGNVKKQKDRVTKSTRVLVGTPGRVLELIADRKLKGISCVVLDEPEPLLASKDAAFLVEVLSRPPFPQLVLAGATFGDNSAEFIRRLMGPEVVRTEAAPDPLTTQISHGRLNVRDAGDRDLQLRRLLQREKAHRAIVYVNQAHLIRHLFRYLNEGGVRAVSLSQDRTKEQCKQALREFSAGQAEVLLTTDRAATGIDIQAVPWVIHYELPRSTQAYVHRAGRTGRAGLSGHSVAMVSDAERIVIKRLERELNIVFDALSAR